MFPNLEAEQARSQHTNEFIASKLGITRQSYLNKKKNGSFKLDEVKALLNLFNADYYYFFATTAQKYPVSKPKSTPQRKRAVKPADNDEYGDPPGIYSKQPTREEELKELEEIFAEFS